MLQHVSIGLIAFVDLIDLEHFKTILVVLTTHLNSHFLKWHN